MVQSIARNYEDGCRHLLKVRLSASAVHGSEDGSTYMDENNRRRSTELLVYVDDDVIVGTLKHTECKSYINELISNDDRMSDIYEEGFSNEDFPERFNIYVETGSKQYNCKVKEIPIAKLQKHLSKEKQDLLDHMMFDSDKLIEEIASMLHKVVGNGEAGKLSENNIVLVCPTKKSYYDLENNLRSRSKRTKAAKTLNTDFLRTVLLEMLNHFLPKSASKDLFSIPSKVILPDFIFRNPTSHQILSVSKNRSMEMPLMRIYSFRNWPNSSSISAVSLSNAGFYCRDAETETVECHSCDLAFKVSDLNGQNPMRYHITHSPDCIFAQQHARQFLDQSTLNLNESDGEANFGTTQTELGNISNNTANVKINPTLGILPNLQTNEIQQTTQRSFYVDTPPQCIATGIHNATETVSITDQIQNGASFISRDHREETETENSMNESTTSERRSRDTMTTNNSVLETFPTNDNTRSPDTVQILSYPPRNPAYATLIEREATFRYWNFECKPNTQDLAEAGFYFTGDMDTVRCFHCDIGLADWKHEDDPWAEHARHSPDCPFLTSNRDRAYIENIQRAWSTVYTPKHKHMADYARRFQTFENSSWPREYVLQTPEMIASAGFFYTGVGDTVRCHYCDGGLREWEPHDDPWREHARWFPFCKFIIRTKGIEFVRNAATETTDEPREPQLPAAFTRTNNEPLTISYEEQCRRKEQRNPMYSAAAQSLTFSLGYTKAKVKKAINIYIARTGRRDFKAVDLLDIVMEKEEAGCSLSSDDEDYIIKPNNEPSRASGGGISDDEDEFPLSAEAIKKENERLVELKICIVCKERDRSMLYVPCGHRLVCDQCADQQDVCNHCNTVIRQRIKTYFG